jgi:IMP dehydrogenase
MKILPEVALTYDDVLLVPQYSDVESRRKLSTSTQLTSKIPMQIPIVSANMDTVTENEMGIVMAREGGIGIIHRFLTIDDQVKQIRRVKKAESFVVDNPITLIDTSSVGDAQRLVEETETGGIVIVDASRRVVGIVTTRDMLFENHNGRPVTDIMTKKVVTAPPNTKMEDAEKILHEHRVEKLPLVDADGVLVGLITLKDIMKNAKFPKATKDMRGRLAVGAAVGVKGSELKRVERLLEAGADCIVVDIAHGDSKAEIEIIGQIRENFPKAQIIGGNVATAEGT